MTEKDAIKTDLYFEQVYTSYTTPTLESLIAQGYGMFKNQTVNDWYRRIFATLNFNCINDLYIGSLWAMMNS